MKAKQSVRKQGGTKQSSPSFPTVGQRVSICSGQQIRLYLAIHYSLSLICGPANLLARRIINVPVLDPYPVKSQAGQARTFREAATRPRAQPSQLPSTNLSHSIK
jgi:hypothetical protein